MRVKVNEWKELWGSEWEYVMKLGSAILDREDKREFWENIKARKLANRRFSIYDLFPRNESITKRAMRECCDFVRSLRAETKEEDPVKVEEATEMGLIIELGGHVHPLCLWPKRNEESA